MSHTKSLIGFISNCRQCDWVCECYLTGQRKASEHARKTGHVVEAEQTYSVEYGKLKHDQP